MVGDGAVHAVGDDHRAGVAVDLAGQENRLMEVVDHDLGFDGHGVLVALDVAA